MAGSSAVSVGATPLGRQDSHRGLRLPAAQWPGSWPDRVRPAHPGRGQVLTDTTSPLINCCRQDGGSSSRWMPASSLSPLPPRS